MQRLTVGFNQMPLLGKSQGVRRYVHELEAALRRLGVSVTPAPSVGGSARALYQVPKAGFLLRQADELFVTPARMRHRVDVLHYTDTYGPLAPSSPVVVTVHDTTFITHPHFHEPHVVRWLCALAKNTWPRADALVAVSEVTARDLRKLGIPPEKITVIPHGVDHVRPPLGKIPASVRGGRYFAYVGNIEPRKGLPTLIEAFRKASPRLPNDIHLAIAGVHAWGPGLHTDSADEKVNLLGWLDDAMLSDFIGGSVAFIYPSQYEGFGLPPLEALQVGAPIVVGDTPVAREVLGRYATYFPPGDADELAERLIDVANGSIAASPEDARKHAAKFRWDNVAARTLELYERVAS